MLTSEHTAVVPHRLAWQLAPTPCGMKFSPITLIVVLLPTKKEVGLAPVSVGAFSKVRVADPDPDVVAT